MQNIYLQKLICPFLLLLINLPFFSVSISSSVASVSSSPASFWINAPQLEAKPSLVGAIRLSWTPVAGATGYVLEMSNTGSAETFVTVKTFGASDKSYRHTGLYYSQKVYYRIKALGNGEESAYSAVVNATTHAQGHVFNIMPLGDSNTEGGRGDANSADKVSYRAKLAQLLDASASKGRYDFVGSQRSGSNFTTDTDHAGFGGATIQNITDLLKDRSYGGTTNAQGLTYLQEYQPDIILLHIGTNDADGSDAAIVRLEGLLNEINKYKASSGKDVTVILAKIIKRVCYDDVFVYSSNCLTPVEAEATLVYNRKMEAMAQKRQADGDNLVFVDMQDGAGIIYKWPSDGGDMADPVHPTQSGYDKMAPVWFAELDKLLNVQPQVPADTEAPETNIVSKPATLSNSSSATFSFSSNESNVVYLASLDGAAFVQVTNPVTFNNLADGVHEIQVKAKDANGNVDGTPASYTWTIDTEAPAAPVVSSPSENTILDNNKPSITGTAEAGATITVFNGVTQLGTVTAGADGNWSYVPSSALSDGEQQITAKATDGAGNTGNASSVRRFIIDTKAPETIIATAPAVLTNQTKANFTFTSNEASVKYEVSVDGGAYIQAETPFSLTGLTDGTHVLAVKAVDAAGNKDATPATHTWTIDTQAPAAPTIARISEDRGPEENDQVTSDNTVVLYGTAEAKGKVQVYKGGASIGGTTANASGAWEFDFRGTELAEGVHQFTATATDEAGNVSRSSANFTVTIDLAAPKASLATTQKSPVKEALEVHISFTEQIYGLALSDFSVTNGVLSNLTAVSSTNYTATLTPTADGVVRLNLLANKVTDLAGNPNTASEVLEATFDGTKPQLSINSDAVTITNKPFTVNLIFSEPVTGFEVGDIIVINAVLSKFTMQSGNTYTAEVNPQTDGEVSVSVSADKAFDVAGNGNLASAIFKRAYDAQSPTVVLSTVAPDPTNKPFTVKVNFSEEITGLETNDFSVTNGVASQLSKTDNQTFTLLITPAASGEVLVSMAADKVADKAANGNLASNTLELVYDSSRPSIAISTDAAAVINEPFTLTIKLTEPVTDLNLSAITLTNATAAKLEQVNELEYKVLIRPGKDGSVSAQVTENKVHDAATNGNTASNKLERIYDATAPDNYKVKFAVRQVDFANQSRVDLNVSGAEIGTTYFYSVTSSNGNEKVTGTAAVSATDFIIPGLNLSILQDGLLTASLYLIDEGGNKGEAVTDQVEKLTKDIIAIEHPAGIKVPFRTDFNKLSLPERVRVTYATQEKENIKVNWQKGNYDSNVAGQYLLEGKLELAPNTSNTEGKTASITVEVEPNKAPTALALSKNAFKPDIAPTEVIGAFSTTDPDDIEFTYALVPGKGDADNNLFEILDNNKLHLKSNKWLYGKSKFSIRVQSMDPYQNKISQEFLLTKIPFEPNAKIKLINAFSPDGDGINDTWTVPELRYYNSVEVAVYDRAGVRLFHTLNPEEGWDGKGKDGNVVQGSYFYIIQVKDIDLVQKGVVTVLK